jgi:hypothetical protein
MANEWPKSRFLAPFTACASLLLASLANFLVHNDYPLLRLEVLLVVSALLALSIAATLLYLVLPRLGRSFLEGVLAALFVELNTTSLPLAIAAGALVGGISLWKRASLTKPMTLFGSIVLVTTLLGFGGRTPWLHSVVGKTVTSTKPPDASKPAILHLILDEQIGVEGLPESDADAIRLADQLRTFYMNAGFATYGGAYSEHMRTMNALPHVLNYGERLGLGMRGRTVRVGPTKHFDHLVDQGYRLTVLQADFADFCSDVRYSECVTYQSSSPTSLLGTSLTTIERAGLIATKFLSLSQLVSAGLLPWRLVAEQLGLPQLSPGNLGRSTSAAMLPVFDELTRRVSNARPGNVYFAHLLLPHYPYALDENCRLLNWRDWEKPFAGRNLTKRQHAYYAQVRCTTRKIDTLLKALDHSPAGKNTVVIIHGDHGSRITEVKPTDASIGKFSESDVIATYSTLFAVRAPQIRPAYSSERLPISMLLKDFAASRFTSAPSPSARPTPTVHLDGPNGVPGQRVALPGAWVNRHLPTSPGPSLNARVPSAAD